MDENKIGVKGIRIMEIKDVKEYQNKIKPEIGRRIKHETKRK